MLVAVGCGKTEVKKLHKEILIGDYELKVEGVLYRLVFLGDGSYEAYKNGEKEKGSKHWKIEGGEVHVFSPETGDLPFFKARKNTDGSLTRIAPDSAKELHYSKIK